MPNCTILGINFKTGTAQEVVTAGLTAGLVVIPSAPVLVRMTEDAAHREALLNADMAITDSGLMVLIWKFKTGERLVRVSGLEYLRLLLQELAAGARNSAEVKSNSGRFGKPYEPNVVWIMPTQYARNRSMAWLNANGHYVKDDDCCVAPLYPPSGPIEDCMLLDWVRTRRPRHIIICLGGGVQERLGYFLMQALEREARGEGQAQKETILPGIHCVGAAMGFLSGVQVSIPMWADYLYLGWLFRCVSAPWQFVPRYWKAARLILLLWRFGKDAP